MTWLNFSKTGKVQKRGKINLIGRLQLSTEKSKEEDNEGIMQLRILRVQVKFHVFQATFLHTVKILNVNSDTQKKWQ